jgi:hypothetical protein
MNEEGAKVSIAAHGDSTEASLETTRVLSRGETERRATLPGRSDTASSKTAFATSTAMRVSFCMDGLLLALTQHRLWHTDADGSGEESISSMKLTKPEHIGAS